MMEPASLGFPLLARLRRSKLSLVPADIARLVVRALVSVFVRVVYAVQVMVVACAPSRQCTSMYAALVGTPASPSQSASESLISGQTMTFGDAVVLNIPCQPKPRSVQAVVPYTLQPEPWNALMSVASADGRCASASTPNTTPTSTFMFMILTLYGVVVRDGGSPSQ